MSDRSLTQRIPTTRIINLLGISRVTKTADGVPLLAIDAFEKVIAICD